MKTVFIIESAEELMQLACKHRASGDKTPVISHTAKLVFEGHNTFVKLEGDPSFRLSGELSEHPDKIINAMAQRCDFSGAFFT